MSRKKSTIPATPGQVESAATPKAQVNLLVLYDQINRIDEALHGIGGILEATKDTLTVDVVNGVGAAIRTLAWDLGMASEDLERLAKASLAGGAA